MERTKDSDKPSSCETCWNRTVLDTPASATPENARRKPNMSATGTAHCRREPFCRCSSACRMFSLFGCSARGCHDLGQVAPRLALVPLLNEIAPVPTIGNVAERAMNRRRSLAPGILFRIVITPACRTSAADGSILFMVARMQSPACSAAVSDICHIAQRPSGSKRLLDVQTTARIATLISAPAAWLG